jgi:hypothetical protein
MAGADGGESSARWTLDIDDASPGEIALKRTRSFLFNLSPRRIGNGGKLAMEIIHVGFLL